MQVWSRPKGPSAPVSVRLALADNRSEDDIFDFPRESLAAMPIGVTVADTFRHLCESETW